MRRPPITCSVLPALPARDTEQPRRARGANGLGRMATAIAEGETTVVGLPGFISMMDTRRDQLFPTLDAADLARIGRFGVRRRYARGEKLVSAGETSPGMVVLLAGEIDVTQRDGLGRVVPIVRYGAGQFLAEVGQ